MRLQQPQPTAAGAGAADLCDGADTSITGPLASPSSLPASFATATRDHLAPALQQPGYDAFPTAFLCLLETLRSGRGSAGTGGGGSSSTGLLEARYRAQLRGSVRTALLHLVLLAERLDYGRLKAPIDEAAPFLFEWLTAEETLLLPRDASVTATLDSSGGGGDLGTPAAGLAGLEPLPGVIVIDSVYAALRALVALFESRVKTIPKPLLARFRAKLNALPVPPQAS